MKTLLTQAAAGARVLVVLTVLLGVLYPLSVWAVGRIPGLADSAEGSVRTVDGAAVGSALIGIDPVPADPAADPYFHTRPSAGADGPLGPGDPAASGASNKGPANADLVALVGERRQLVAAREQVPPAAVPVDAVTASASGLDPQISPAYAELQSARVARITGLDPARVRELVAAHTARAGIGLPGVNVGELNLAVRAERGGR